jgi:hypothetical protein
MPEQTTAQKLGVDGYVEQSDIDEIVAFSMIKYTSGLIPSDVMREANEYASKLVDKFDLPAITKMKISACLFESAMIQTKLHPDYRVKRTRQG